MFRYQPLLFQPVEPRLGFSLSEMCEEVRAAVFPEVEEELEVRYRALRPLASIWNHFMGRDRHLIVLRPVLNHPQTPP